MEITPDLVKKVAQNARLRLKDEEIKTFAKDLQDILTNFEILNELDTANVPPSFHPTPIQNITREDTPQPCVNREDALALTPHKKDKYFKGPKTL
ncbi:Asp-tRNA(Asn)/Glu-tRNA(Gln) amidotransferase subunit GatC [Candidatus Woesearchaeota archaeon]|nr:MAG: Asp-tRNA(Asn)/Glu-tRNA(Gln) amidotransferase subunit GatC [Candidatus Woesearchaeota archaeon]